MSMLQQILQSMHVEPELLAELDDDQKQILFCKMREEQLRRWKALEAKSACAPKTSSKKIQWLLGSDGEPWTWVMGEHSNDKTIEEILEKEAMETAHKLAEIEVQKERKQEEERLKKELEEEEHLPDSLENSGDFDNLEPSTSGVEELMQKLRTEKVGVEEENGESEMEREVEKEKAELSARLESEAERRIREEKERRETEIYQSLKEARNRINLEAEKEENDEKRFWEEQERRSREAEEQLRDMARLARQRHRQHELRTSTSLISALEHSHSPEGTKSPKSIIVTSPEPSNILKLPRPPKPKSRDAIVDWFMKEEFPCGAGLDPKTGLVAPWFHGIISREQSEEYLGSKPPGAFLVRVSERIWGYTLSYSLGNGQHKHFLIERITDGYQFLGTNQIVHRNLWDLISYHETVPITPKGKEVLIQAVGQTNSKTADHHELFKSVIARARNNL